MLFQPAPGLGHCSSRSAQVASTSCAAPRIPPHTCKRLQHVANELISRQACSSTRSAKCRGHPLSSPAGIVLHDLSFISEKTGLDLHVPESVIDVHDQVVAVLNPLAEEEMQRSLEEQIHRLQQQLDEAHKEVHSTESRLGGTIADLGKLQSAASNFQQLTQAGSPAADLASATAVSSNQQRRPNNSSRSRALDSSFSIPDGLKEYWYPAEFTSTLTADTMVPFELFGEAWVLFRDENGAAACVRDECAHRACPLSLGSVVAGHIQCPYHGWEYDGSGSCTKMPSTVQCKGVKVKALPVVELDGFVWVYPGRKQPPACPSTIVNPPSGFVIHAELLLEVEVEHGLLLENLLDLAHAPFTHTQTFAKGWPVPDVVKFNAQKLLGGNWEPYPIDMSFEPPCIVLSTIGLAQPGKIECGARAEHCKKHLHQLHICLPSTQGKTRLLYRMSMDFMEWTKHVPGIQAFWKHIANQVMGEDLVLVAGQQDRMKRGADVWANPVAYDKLGVRYRRWRNSVGSGNTSERQQMEKEFKPMSAGQLFEMDGEDGCLVSYSS